MRTGPYAAGVVEILGRDAELELVVARLRDRRLVTLVGPGGIGKTTLARTAAELIREEWRHALTLEAGHVGSWVWDVPTGAVTGNDIVRRMYGLDPVKHITADDFFAAVEDDHLPAVRAALQATFEDGRTSGGVLIFADEATHRWNVVIHGLPPAPPGYRYQFWFICDAGMVRGTEVAADTSRPTMFTTGMPRPQSCPEVKGAALTEEPVADGQGPPRGKPLAHLML